MNDRYPEDDPPYSLPNNDNGTVHDGGYDETDQAGGIEDELLPVPEDDYPHDDTGDEADNTFEPDEPAERPAHESRALATPREIAPRNDADTPESDRPPLINEPRYVFTGSAKDSPAVRGDFEHFMDEGRNHTTFMGESTQTEENNALSGAIGQAALVVGAKVGFDLTKRVADSRTHFFDELDPYRAAAHSIGRVVSDVVNKEDGDGLNALGVGSLVLKSDDPVIDLSIAAHEQGHDLAATKIVCEVEDIEGILVPVWYESAGYADGLHRSVTAAGHKESVHDMIMDRIIRTMGHDEMSYGYSGVNVLLRGAIDLAAETRGIPPSQIADMLVQDAFGGRRTGLNLLTEVLGPEHAAAYMQLTGGEPMGYIRDLARTWRVPTAERLAKDALAGRFDPFNWDT